MSSTPTFAEAFRSALESAGISQRDFAEKVGISRGFVPLLLAGQRTPPLERLDDFCVALGLAAGSPARAAFHRAALLSHAPEEVRLLVDALEAKLAKAAKQHELIKQELVRLKIELPKT